jgi:hypothetical protein
MKFTPNTTEILEDTKDTAIPVTLEEKYNLLLETLEVLGSYEYCNCGCLNSRAGRIITPPAHVWHLANTALKNVGHKIKVYPNEA